MDTKMSIHDTPIIQKIRDITTQFNLKFEPSYRDDPTRGSRGTPRMGDRRLPINWKYVTEAYLFGYQFNTTTKQASILTHLYQELIESTPLGQWKVIPYTKTKERKIGHYKLPGYDAALAKLRVLNPTLEEIKIPGFIKKYVYTGDNKDCIEIRNEKYEEETEKCRIRFCVLVSHLKDEIIDLVRAYHSG